MPNKTKFDIYDRSLEFAVRVAKLVNRLPKNCAGLEYGRQVIRSSGSIGANLEEADGTLTKKDFINKIGIARREARESKHWLRLIERTELIIDEKEKENLNWQIAESQELMLILSSIIRNTEKK